MLLSGATGAGKSTLLRALAGETLEHDTRTSAGHVFIGDTEVTSFAVGSRHAVLVPQLPQEGSLESEVGQNGIFSHGLAGKPVATLSHGEAYRLALDEAMKRSPTLLLLDEPAAALDEAGVSMLVDQLNKVSSLGTTIVIAEHRIGAFENIATKKYQLSAGRLLPGTYVPEPSPPVRSLPLFDRGQQLASIQIRELPELISAANIELHLGECLAITGHNGAGKSTLLKALATNLHVSVSVLGKTFDGYDPTSVALVPDLPASFFVTDSLENELRRADRVASAATGLTRLTIESILGESVAPRLSTHPLDLSSGTQLALAVAMQLSHKPQLLLLDEPVQGLDPRARQLMAETIRCVQETGCAVIFATHDLEFAHSLADRVFEINERKLRQISQEVL